MKKLFYLFPLCFLIFLGCNQGDREGLDRAVANNTDSTLSKETKYYLENTKIEFGSPITFDSIDNILIPIIFDQKYTDKRMPKQSFFNIALIDSTDRVKKLLFEESVVIEGIKTLTYTSSGKFYEAREYVEKNISNFAYVDNYLLLLNVWKYKDRKKDYRRLFVYDVKNDRLQQLSPEDGNVTDFHIFDKQSKILITYQFDSDKNDIFNEKDDENMVIVDPKSKPVHQPLFDLDKLKEIKMQVAEEN